MEFGLSIIAALRIQQSISQPSTTVLESKAYTIMLIRTTPQHIQQGHHVISALSVCVWHWNWNDYYNGNRLAMDHQWIRLLTAGFVIIIESHVTTKGKIKLSSGCIDADEGGVFIVK